MVINNGQLATLGTQDTGLRQVIHKNTTQHRKLWATQTPPKKSSDGRYVQKERKTIPCNVLLSIYLFSVAYYTKRIATFFV